MAAGSVPPSPPPLPPSPPSPPPPSPYPLVTKLLASGTPFMLAQPQQYYGAGWCLAACTTPNCTWDSFPTPDMRAVFSSNQCSETSPSAAWTSVESPPGSGWYQVRQMVVESPLLVMAVARTCNCACYKSAVGDWELKLQITPCR